MKETRAGRKKWETLNGEQGNPSEKKQGVDRGLFGCQREIAVVRERVTKERCVAMGSLSFHCLLLCFLRWFGETGVRKRRPIILLFALGFMKSDNARHHQQQQQNRECGSICTKKSGTPLTPFSFPPLQQSRHLQKKGRGRAPHYLVLPRIVAISLYLSRCCGYFLRHFAFFLCFHLREGPL